MAINVQTLQDWTALVAAARPLVAIGELAVEDVAGLFRKANPGATDEELNAVLAGVAADADAEVAAIEQEKADAGGVE